MNLSRIILCSCLPLLLVAGCNDDDENTDEEEGAQEIETFEDQVELGMDVYGEHCAECHGASGMGTDKAPRLVGLEEGALPLDPPPERKVRKTQFVTVADVAEFAVMYMPGDDPGSLSEKEYLAVLAFDLSANGIELNEPLTLELAGMLTIPR